MADAQHRSIVDVRRLVSSPFEVNLFVVSEGDRALIVDASSGLDMQALAPRIADATRGLTVETLYLTHVHVDHVGGAAAIRRQTGATVRMHEGEAFAVENGDARLTGGALFGAPQEACPVARVKEGDVIELGARRFEVVLVPGHSPAHTALWDAESRALFCGDVVFEGGSFGRVDLPGSNPSDLVKSLEKLAALDPVAFYPGHMRPAESNAREAILESLENARLML